MFAMLLPGEKYPLPDLDNASEGKLTGASRLFIARRSFAF
jgi:hypothetical protein